MSSSLEPAEMERRSHELAWLLCDVDGVLTDGRLEYGRTGETTKRFHVHDGLGLQVLQGAGLRVGLLSARDSAPLRRRAEELGLDAAMLGVAEKWQAFQEFLDRTQLAARQVAYIGDDLTDLKVLARCGLALAPSDAVEEVRTVCQVTLHRAGGQGAVREACELILKARGEWERLLAGYTFAAE